MVQTTRQIQFHNFDESAINSRAIEGRQIEQQVLSCKLHWTKFSLTTSFFTVKNLAKLIQTIYSALESSYHSSLNAPGALLADDYRCVNKWASKIHCNEAINRRYMQTQPIHRVNIKETQFISLHLNKAINFNPRPFRLVFTPADLFPWMTYTVQTAASILKSWI